MALRAINLKPETHSAFLEAKGIHFSYHDRGVLTGVDVELGVGDLVGLLGPNGSGKTTLLRALSGFLQPQRGRVRLNDQDLNTLNREQIARHIAIVPQELHVPFAFSVWEMVMMGRTSYISRFHGETEQDRQVVEEKLELTNTLQFADRVFNELSGGEQQRVIVAMALAQEPDILLLDEPTVHLDIQAQLEVLELVKKLNRQTGLIVMAAMHDLNLAALYFDRIILLFSGGIAAQGTPREVLQEGHIQHVFKTDVKVRSHPMARTPLVIILPYSPYYRPPALRGLHSISAPCNSYYEELQIDSVYETDVTQKSSSVRAGEPVWTRTYSQIRREGDKL